MICPKLVNQLIMFRRCHAYNPCQPPLHLICFKNWTADMVLEIISSAINLKTSHQNTHLTRLNVMENAKVMILQEVNEPVLKMAVSKAATFMGANDVTIIDHLLWDSDYLGRVFSMMCDVIFVATTTQYCVQRFAEQSTVPVLCTRSRAQASLQAMATVMAAIEEYGTMQNLNIAYIGQPHPVLNSYLLLCPMLGANFKFKCCCQKVPVSPLLYKTSQDMTEKSHTKLKQCGKNADVIRGASVIIAGPTGVKPDKIEEFTINSQHQIYYEYLMFLKCKLPRVYSSNFIASNFCKFLVIADKDLMKNCARDWIFLHTCPRGKEVDDSLFSHSNARTFNAFNNMQYIAAALMSKSVMGQIF